MKRLQFGKLILNAVRTDEPATVSKVAGTGADETMLAVPLHVPETEKFIEAAV